MKAIGAYELQEIVFHDEVICYELVRVGASSRIEKMMYDPRTRTEVVNLFKTVKKIKERGVRDSLKTSRLRRLPDGERLFEIKNYSDASREMSCIVTEEARRIRIVLLFDFKGHQGSDAIPEHVLKKGKRLSEEAFRLMRNQEKEVRS